MRTLFLVAVFVSAVSTPALALDITTCDQTVPAGQTGRLLNDIVCTTELLGVGLEKDATLEMNGFSLSGGSNMAVSCRDSSCTIIGPGVIDGDWVAVNLESKVDLTISDVIIRNADVAILGRAVLRDPNRVAITNVTIEDSYNWAISAQVIRANGLTVSGCGFGSIAVVLADRLTGTEINVSNNLDIGIKARKVKATNLIADGNEGVGVNASGRAVLIDSHATGNAAGGSGVDIFSGRKPKLINTTCGSSYGDKGVPWGVCTND